jgi:hypothetical protein
MITESNLWKWLRVKPQKITEEGYLIMNLKDRHVFMLTILQLVQYIPLNFICQSVTQIPPIFSNCQNVNFNTQRIIVWYTTQPIGEKMLNDMMKNLSKDAGLSKIYTNYSVRATTDNLLTHCGVPDKEIMRITGHKCEASLSSYNADLSDNQKKRYSAILQGIDSNESDVNNTVATVQLTAYTDKC